MKLTKKVDSFTLSEMVVVLILTSIVVGLAFSVLTLVQKQMLAIQSNYEKSLTMNKLETTLWLDFNNFSNVTFDDLENELKFKSDVDSLFYKIDTDHIIRKEDTFKLKIKSKQFFLQGVLINEGKTDAIKIILGQDYLNKKLFVFKSNDAAIFMKD